VLKHTHNDHFQKNKKIEPTPTPATPPTTTTTTASTTSSTPRFH
jgi:hypothetical protein